jgi:hypothetical protein
MSDMPETTWLQTAYNQGIMDTFESISQKGICQIETTKAGHGSGSAKKIYANCNGPKKGVSFHADGEIMGRIGHSPFGGNGQKNNWVVRLWRTRHLRIK